MKRIAQASPASTSASTDDQIGPRHVGTVYDNASGTFEVRAVVTEHYTGAIWTGSDRVLKAVA